jgi:hypothetical protein
MHKLTIAVLLIVCSVTGASQASTTTVRYVHQWRYSPAGQNGPDYELRYEHEFWDAESTGFVLSCPKEDKTFLDVSYYMLDARFGRTEEND